jgi:hypothetical protein
LDSIDGYALDIGGVRVTIRPSSTRVRLEPPASAREFLASTVGAPDATLVVDWEELDPAPPGELLFDSGGSWRLYARHGREVYRVFDSRLGAVPFKEAELTADGREGWIRLDPRFHAHEEPVDALQFPLDELLFLRLMADRGAAELHACGVVTAGGAALAFCGQSGDGKTTTARLWQGEPGTVVLSDDRIVLRRAEDGRGFWAYGTPWHGEAEIAQNRRAPLAAVHVLVWGERNTLEPLGAAEALSLLLARSFPPFHHRERMARTLQFLEEVVQNVPCLRLAFVPGADAVRTVLDRLSLDRDARPAVR